MTTIINKQDNNGGDRVDTTFNRFGYAVEVTPISQHQHHTYTVEYRYIHIHIYTIMRVTQEYMHAHTHIRGLLTVSTVADDDSSGISSGGYRGYSAALH